MMNTLELAQQLAERPYPFQIFRDDESDVDIRYLARNPDLEGCMAQGATIREALASLLEARVDYISFLLERGLPVPDPSDLPRSTSATTSSVLVVITQSEPEPQSIEEGLLYEGVIKT